MKSKFPYLTLLLAAAALLGLAGCNGSSSSGAMLNLGVADTPVDGAQSVVVAFTGVDLMGPNGQVSFKFNTEQKIDLLQQQGTNSASLLTGQSIPAGNYQWIRLDVDAANSYIITSDGTQHALTIPSSSQTGLKLVSGFTIAQGSLENFVIDFNLRKAITQSNASGTTSFMLTPALRLINMQQVGGISGSASSTLSIGSTLISATTCDPAVYVYPGTVTTLSGFNVSLTGGTAPLTSATLNLNSTTGNYDYTVGFLAPGTYTLAVTCGADDTAGATTLAFSATKTATVTANTATTLTF